MRGYRYAIYVVAVTLAMLAGVELASHWYLAARGVASPMFFDFGGRGIDLEHQPEGPKFSTIDPHLGFTYGNDDDRIKKLSGQYTWVEGFLIYANDATSLQRPIILALGGSTTDGILFGHSWPQELANILKQNNIPGTVINGGIGGYSTNQDLLKLVRDGLEFHPDLIISYAGINDRGDYGRLPYPMVHTYQRMLLERLTGRAPATVLPSTMAMIKHLLTTDRAESPGYSLGMKTSRSLGEQYRKNIELMDAAATSQGASFDAFIQPFAFYRSKHGKTLDPRIKGADYIREVLELYGQIVDLPKTHPYIHDATLVLENASDVYKPDGVHLKIDGDKAIARYIFSVLAAKIRHPN